MDEFVDIHNLSELAWRVLCNVNYATDMLVSKGPLDDLDHSNPSSKFGAKLGVDATRKIAGEGYTSHWPDDVDMSEDIKQITTATMARYFGNPISKSITIRIAAQTFCAVIIPNMVEPNCAFDSLDKS